MCNITILAATALAAQHIAVQAIANLFLAASTTFYITPIVFTASVVIALPRLQQSYLIEIALCKYLLA